MVVPWEAWRSTEEILEAPGVYALLFADPPAAYIGCTARTFGERFAEHHRLLEKGVHSCLALQQRYLREEGHMLICAVMSVVIGQNDLHKQEAACLQNFQQMAPGCEILNNAEDWVWKRAELLDFSNSAKQDAEQRAIIDQGMARWRERPKLLGFLLEELDYCIQSVENGRIVYLSTS